MKNVLKRLNKFPIAWVTLLVWWTAPLYIFPYPLETYKVTQQRADYFLVKIPLANKITIGTPGDLYLEHQKVPVGTFKVIDVKDNECLCVIESIRPGLTNNRISRISFTSRPGQQKSKHKPLPPLIIKGVRFIHLGNNGTYYLSVPPIPLKTIEPLSAAGIKNLLFQIEEKNHRYRADFIRFTRIRPLGLDKIIDFADKNRIYLGTVEGKLSMIYQENGVFLYTRISSSTLKKFRNDIFFHVMLEKKER
jgi:hypothetical protein